MTIIETMKVQELMIRPFPVQVKQVLLDPMGPLMPPREWTALPLFRSSSSSRADSIESVDDSCQTVDNAERVSGK
jgi:hypothetical protein